MEGQNSAKGHVVQHLKEWLRSILSKTEICSFDRTNGVTTNNGVLRV